MKLINLKTGILGQKVIYYNKIDSTQEEMWRLMQNNNLENGTIIIADIQTNGKGTHGRIWHTDEINNIAFSLYIKANCSVNQLNGLTIDIAKTLVSIFKKEYNINVEISEPNDLNINGKKIGGILTECKVINKNVKHLVIGIGINTTKTNFTSDIKDIATSIYRELNIEIDREKIISDFCNEFEEIVQRRKIL